MEVANKKELITQEDIQSFLHELYGTVMHGIPKVSPSIEEFAENYLAKYSTKEEAAKAMFENQIIKCTTSGFVTGFGGFLTMPITLPANVTSVLYVQMRMIACSAYMGGYELDSDEVQTFVYACLAGVAVNQVVKKVAVKAGQKFANAMIGKIPGKVLIKINQKVGFRFITKFGTKGIINLGKAIPVVGAVVGGSLDLVETKIIANRAHKWFIEHDFSVDEHIENHNFVEVDGAEFCM